MFTPLLHCEKCYSTSVLIVLYSERSRMMAAERVRALRSLIKGTRANGVEFSQTVLDLASLVSWVCRLTQTDCRICPRVSSCCLFTLVYLTEELVDPGNSRSFAPAPFQFSDTVELVQLLREVSRSPVSATFQRSF